MFLDSRAQATLAGREQQWVEACENSSMATVRREGGTTGGGGVAALPLGTMEAGPR